MKQIPKPITVLKSLLAGAKVTMDGREYLMSEDGNLCFEGTSTNTNTNKTEDILLVVDISFYVFIQMANKLSDDECVLLNANLALTAINKKDRSNISE